MTKRSFLSTVGARITMLGAVAATASPIASAQSPAGGRWQATRHKQDDWLDALPGQHRLVFDTTEPAGMSAALLFSNNYYLANQSGYGLQNSDLAVVIIARHQSTAFAYNEEIWSKYGVPISNFIDRTKEPSKTNIYSKQLSAAIGRGVHLAVCEMATRALSGVIARAVSANQDDIVKEISANLLPNSHLVAAGIVAVGRAQEHGYALVNAG